MIKKGNDKKKLVDSKNRVLLIRKGNEYFSNGNIEAAEKIFVIVDYKDGLVRLGDYYLEKNNLYKAAEMYFMSENPSKIDFFCKRSAEIIRKLIRGDKIEDKIYTKKDNEFTNIESLNDDIKNNNKIVNKIIISKKIGDNNKK